MIAPKAAIGISMPTSLNTSMVHNRFLSNQEDLGVVAVGFSGGQVREIP